MSGKLNRYRTGFTLVELIAVIGIISILAAILVVGMGYVTKRTLIAKTKSTLGKLQLAIGQFREDFGFYPPDSTDSTAHTENWKTLEDIINNQLDYSAYPAYNYKNPDPDEYNLSSEMLYFFLYEMYDVINSRDSSGNMLPDNVTFLGTLERKRAYVEFKQNELRDTDEDGVKEIVDGWGTSILFVAKDAIPPEPHNIEPHHNKNPQTYSLYSKGRDGLALYKKDLGFPGEKDYSVEDVNHDGKIDGSDKTKERNDINNKYKDAEEPIEMANKDNITNWGTPY